jgi:glycosyltransferase involved in cell wall biosynthesis
MKIVLTHPYCWPYVRRGSERNLDNVARYLVSRGHEVVTVSTHPDGIKIEEGGSGKRILHKPWWTPALGLGRISELHTFFFPVLKSLLGMEPDAVHSFFYMDALAAAAARRSRNYRTVFQMNGIALPGISCYRFPPEAMMWRQTLKRVDERVVCTKFIGELLTRFYGLDYKVVFPPVETDDFPLGGGPVDQRPTIISAADFNVPRKGVRVLVQAFRIVKETWPDAVLNLSGRMEDALRDELLGSLPENVRKDVHCLGLGKPGDLPAQYRGASVMALAAMWEPSGGAMLEAWSSGTPVVATNHGGLPEFMTEGVGFLFDPLTDAQESTNAEGLADALIRGLELAQQPGVRERCREHAERFSTRRIGPVLESLYAGN